MCLFSPFWDPDCEEQYQITQRGEKIKEMKSYKIWNIPTFVLGMLISLSVIMMLGALCVFLYVKTSVSGYISWGVSATVSVAVLIFICLYTRAEVYFDGEVVHVKNVFRERKIDLKEIKKVDVKFHPGSARSGGVYIELIFEYDPDNLYGYKSTSLYNGAKSDIDTLIKGDYSEENILILYNEIIDKYPSKKGSLG